MKREKVEKNGRGMGRDWRTNIQQINQVFHPTRSRKVDVVSNQTRSPSLITLNEIVICLGIVQKPKQVLSSPNRSIPCRESRQSVEN